MTVLMISNDINVKNRKIEVPDVVSTVVSW